MKRLFKNTALSAIAATMVFASAPTKATAGQDPFVGEISFVGFNFAPVYWEECDGQLLSINSYPALYSLLTTMYGGNGTTNFKLPDMRGRVPVHRGTGPGLTYRQQGYNGGLEYITLSSAYMPSHTHTATAESVSGTTVTAGTASVSSTMKVADDTVVNAKLGSTAKAIGRGLIYTDTAPTVSLQSGSIESTLNLSGLAAVTTTSTTVTVDPEGGGNAFPIMQPYTVVNCIIATDGIYPTRP